MKKEKFDLETLPRKNIFKVPENYFEKLALDVETRISEETKVLPLRKWSPKHTLFAVAASSAIAIMGFFWVNSQEKTIENMALTGVSQQEIVNYLIQENMSQSEVTEHFDNPNSLKINDTDLLENLKVSDKEILQSVDLENIEEEI
jgi:predicted XRE-type DNA-binding protein